MSSVRTPNEEQLIGINHDGGKILSAGAGSGKTFVIIEHIISKLEKLKTEIPKHEWDLALPTKMSRIVLMTFTKKAAGEMSIRLLTRVEGLCQNEKDQAFWILVQKYLSFISVTTISSFCHSLISQGFVKEIGSTVEVVSNVEYKNKITQLFNGWYEQYEQDLQQVFKANSNALIKAMLNVFTSPELRLLWKDGKEITSLENELAPFIDEMLIVKQLNNIDLNLNFSYEKKDEDKAWFIFLSRLSQLWVQEGSLNPTNIQTYLKFSRDCGRLPSSVKTMSEEVKSHLETAKEFIKFLRDIDEDVTNLIENFSIFKQWSHTFSEVFQYIDRNYLFVPGFSFADLEYFVCLAMRDEEIAKKVREQYHYFIVDEFQDTSTVQYEILKNLIGDSKEKLFCVGDRKQAIYGFRGGELQVFTQCSHLLGEENNLFLRNNFRSFGNVINFNNSFFENIFPLGIKFEGFDRYSVQMEKQTVPTHSLEKGDIKSRLVEVNDHPDINLDIVEAHALIEVLENDLKDNEDIKSICILYRKLRPSSYLLELLAEKKFTYNAQIKIAYDEDPLINLFLLLIEVQLNQSNDKKLAAVKFLIQTHLEVLQINQKVETICEQFLGDCQIIGLRLAFHKLVFSCGLNNSLYAQNSKLIDSICKVCQDNPRAVFLMISLEGDEQYSMESINLGQTKQITIMSAHASKGLEFDAVLLAGVHSNGSQMGKTETVGKLPKSFRWKKAYNQKTFFKSPAYYLEAELDKAKDFSESKRLLYVACTRAIKYLGWADINILKDGERIQQGDNSNHWIKALRLGNIPSLPMSFTYRSDLESKEVSMMLKDDMGLNRLEKMPSLGVFAETSVTRLASIVQCPFKFYLSNICKLEPQLKIPAFEFEEDEEEVFYSSKKRGIEVHAWLSDLITKNKILDNYKGPDRDKIFWALQEAQIYSNYKVISEKLIKFSLFGQMISGTPDLVFDSENEIVVWDFKTGARSIENEEHYWFQVLCYGHAYANLKQFAPEKMITLSLLYIDEKQMITRRISFEEITSTLFEKWSKTERLYQVNKDHCSHCEYSSVCHLNATSSS